MTSTSPSSIRTGVVGVGKMGRFHLAKLLSNPASSLVGIYDTHLEHAKKVAEEVGTKAFESLTDLFFECDAVVIAAPTPHHFSIVQQALLAGVHVLVEKPLASSAAEAEHLAVLAQKQKLILTVGHLERFRLKHFLSGLGFSFSVDCFYIEANRIHTQSGREANSIDVISDLMVHDLDLVLALKGQQPLSVNALGAPVINALTDIAGARLEFPDGSAAVINSSRIATVVQRRFQVFGRQGFLNLDFFNQSAEVTLRDDGGVLHRHSMQFSVDCLQEQTSHFLKCIHEARVPLVTAHEAANTLRWAEHIQSQIKDRLHTYGRTINEGASTWTEISS